MSTLHACRQQLAEEGADPEAWLAQQVAARSCVEVTYGIQVRGPLEAYSICRFYHKRHLLCCIMRFGCRTGRLSFDPA